MKNQTETSTTTLTVKYLEELIPDQETFDKLIWDRLKGICQYQDGKATITPQWLSSNFSFYSNKYIYTIFMNRFHKRIPYFEPNEFFRYLENRFLTYLPQFFSRIMVVLEDKLGDLYENAKRGAKTEIRSESNQKFTTMPYNNANEMEDNTVDRMEQNLYNMYSQNKNIIENAALLGQSAISGEVDLFLGSFDGLFTQRDIIAESDVTISYDSTIKKVLDMIMGSTELQEALKGVDGQDGKDGAIFEGKTDITNDPWYERNWTTDDILKKVEVQLSNGDIFEGVIEYFNGFYQISFTGDFERDLVFNQFSGLPFAVVVKSDINKTTVADAIKATPEWSQLEGIAITQLTYILLGSFEYNPDTKTATYTAGTLQIQIVVSDEPLTIEKVILYEPNIGEAITVTTTTDIDDTELKKAESCYDI